MSDQDALIRALDEWRRTSFRLESLDRYTAEHEEGLLTAYLRGEPVPPAEPGLVEWCDLLRRERAAGRERRRVHAIAGPLTPYLRYEIDWAYTACSAAGEDVRILHRPTWADTPFGERPPDFYLLDDERVVVMSYDDVGHWLGGDIVSDPLEVAHYRVLRDHALGMAIPLRDYLAALRRTPITPATLVSLEEAIPAA